MNTTRYVLVFVLALTAIVAVLLTSLREATKVQAQLNEEIFEKRAILKAVQDHLGENVKVDNLSDDEVLNIFTSSVEQKVLDMAGTEVDGMAAEDVDMAKEKKKPEEERVLPLFIYSPEGSADKFYIVSVRGNGLWDEIWGNIAFESDLNTITGATFDHKGETPGLGAEIKDNPTFAKNFKGTKIYKDGEYVSVEVKKGGAQDEVYQVDGISGATVTADGVSEMLYRGIKYYEPFFEKARSK